MRWRRRRAAFGWTVTLLAAAGLGAWATSVIIEPPPARDDAPDQVWYRVAEDTVERRLEVGVRSEWATAGTVHAPASGVLTERLVDDGASLTDGAVIASVDLSPVVVATGTIPSFRPLQLGVAGRDVAQLQAFLERAGWYRGRPTGTFDPGTVAAVRRWERALGAGETGTVPLGRIVYVEALPAPIRWSVPVGGSLVAGTPMAEVLAPEPTFTALLSPDQETELDPGTAVAVTSPAGQVWMASLGSNVVRTDAVQVDLHGDPSICDDGCTEVPVAGQTRLRGVVTVVPATTGPVVPLSAIRSDEHQQRYVTVRGHGRQPVTVVATAAGMSVVDGVETGAEVAIPVEPDG